MRTDRIIWNGWIQILCGLGLGLGALGARAEDALFARLETEPARIYAGQPFSLRLSVFTTGQDLEPGMQISGLPDALQLQPFQDMPVAAQTVNGTAYQVLRTRCEAVCLQPGELRFEPVIHGFAVRSVQTFFFTQQTRTAVRIPIRPFTLTVKAVPADRAPNGYAGLIGSFQLDGAVSTNRALPGDLITLTYQLSGSGRFDRVPVLGHSAIPGFKVYPPRPQSQQAAQSRFFSQVVIPERPGALTIPALTLTAFNPEREAFDILTAGPFTLVPDLGRPTNAPPPLLLPLPDPETQAAPPTLPLHASPGTWNGSPEDAGRAAAYFAAGNNAYRDDRLPEAIDAYAKILALGFRNPQVEANLGAACARAGQHGKAMLYLVRAIRKNPRDSIARSHIARLLQTSPIAGAPDLSPWGRLSRREWGWLSLVALAAAGIWMLPVFPNTQARRRFRIPAALALLLGLASLGGVAWWTAGPPSFERMIVAPSVQGRLAPFEKAMATARLPEGSVVRLYGEQKGWRRVGVDGMTVWIPSTAMDRP